MDVEKIKAVQGRLALLQENIIETANDIDDKMSIAINGKMQIVALNIKEHLTTKEIEEQLPEIINRVIIKVSAKVQEALKVAIS